MTSAVLALGGYAGWYFNKGYSRFSLTAQDIDAAQLPLDPVDPALAGRLRIGELAADTTPWDFVQKALLILRDPAEFDKIGPDEWVAIPWDNSRRMRRLATHRRWKSHLQQLQTFNILAECEQGQLHAVAKGEEDARAAG